MARLVLVPTPIGNLQDITLRALEVLRSVDAIAAEDTRHSRKLLDHYGIDKPMLRLDAHTIAARGEAALVEHQTLAFITDAGTPGISDPGAELVALALERGDEVEALPGPTAFVPALVLSGLPLARFTFEGFLPRKGSDRRARLAAVAASAATSVLYESPRRVLATLTDLARACGSDRRAAVSRELSKRFETTYRGTLAELCDRLGEDDARGEFVIAVAGAAETGFTSEAGEGEKLHVRHARALASVGLTGRQLRDALVALGAPRNLAYSLALETEREG